MNYLQGKYPVIQIRKEVLWDITVFAEDVVAIAKPGQFIHIKIPGFFLRRPISICEMDKQHGTLRFVFDVRGEGTEMLTKLRNGDHIDLMGPIGNGFDLIDPASKVVLVAGGIGVAPLLELGKYYRENATLISGFRDKSGVCLQNDFRFNHNRLILTTEDGSAGYRGLVTSVLEERFAEEKVDIVYTCGPKPMMKEVVRICAENKVRCQVSLEERMACGVGACLGCACKTQDSHGKQGYAHVCKNGPVFEAGEVVWE